jgi:radical SAM superfamily enzyme YgiQ (UPF0313 family)
MMEPLVFAVLAGMTPAEHEVIFFDERIERVPTEEQFDLAAFSVETYTARRAYQLADAFRQHGTPVVLGGFHPTLCPEEAVLHADAIATGEVENTWTHILEDAQCGRLQGIYRSPGRSALTSVPVDRTIFRHIAYLPLALVQFSRGCTHCCDFCSIQQFYGPRLTHRPTADVLAEIDGLPTRNVFFVDDNITADRHAARELFTALKKRRIRWISQASLDIVQDPELLDLMAASGCFGLIIGLESLNEQNLALMKKAWVGSLGGYAQALRAIKERGMLVYGAFVFGYDYDTPASFQQTIHFALEQKLFLATFNMLQPFPGTPLYTQLQAEGRLLYDRWWMDPRYLWDKAAFRPIGMSAEELAEECRKARSCFNSMASIVSRGIDPHAHLKDPFRFFVYLLGNLISRQDIRQKQGLSLGFAVDERTAELVGP